MSDKRITVEEVRAAVVKNTAVRLIYGSFGTGIDCGCPQTQLYLAAGNTVARDPDEDEYEQRSICCNVVSDWAATEYGIPYALAFRTAFDRARSAPVDFDPDDGEDATSSYYVCGYRIDTFCTLSRAEQRHHRRRWQEGCYDGVMAREALFA